MSPERPSTPENLIELPDYLKEWLSLPIVAAGKFVLYFESERGELKIGIGTGKNKDAIKAIQAGFSGALALNAADLRTRNITISKADDELLKKIIYEKLFDSFTAMAEGPFGDLTTDTNGREHPEQRLTHSNLLPESFYNRDEKRKYIVPASDSPNRKDLGGGMFIALQNPQTHQMQVIWGGNSKTLGLAIDFDKDIIHIDRVNNGFRRYFDLKDHDTSDIVVLLR